MQMDKYEGVSRFFLSRKGVRKSNMRRHFHDGVLTKFLFLEFVLGLLLLSATSVYAANVYVRPGATGSNNGSDWTNAYANLPATLVRGNTYYLANGSYGSYTFNDSLSGITWIYIKKATSSAHGTDTGWVSTYGGGQATFTGWGLSTGYYEIDGATGGGPGSWETGLGIKVTNSGKAVTVNANVTGITFKHVELAGGGASAPRSGTSGGEDCDIIYALNGRITNFTMQYCLLRDSNRTGILTHPAPFNGVLIEYTKFARFGAVEHAEPWSMGNDSNVVFRYNIIEDGNATGYICAVNGSGTAANWEIYGNLFWQTGSSGFLNTSVIMVRYDAGCPGAAVCISASNWKVYNNVFANLHGWTVDGFIGLEHYTGGEAYNNVFINNRADNIGMSIGTQGYSWYYNNYGYTNSGQDKSPATSGTNVKGTSDPFVSSTMGNFVQPSAPRACFIGPLQRGPDR